MEAKKHSAAKKVSVSREVRLSDLDGIKKALLFFIERERDREMTEELRQNFYFTCGSSESGSEYIQKLKKEINKKYDVLMKGLK